MSAEMNRGCSYTITRKRYEELLEQFETDENVILYLNEECVLKNRITRLIITD
jgi:hypothetical protein